MNDKPKYPELLDREWLRARYVDEKLSCEQIAELIDFECPSKTVHYWLRKHKIPIRSAMNTAGSRQWTEGQRAAMFR